MQNKTNTVPVAEKPRGLRKTKQPKDLLRDALDASLEVQSEEHAEDLIHDLRESSGELTAEAISAAQKAAEASAQHHEAEPDPYFIDSEPDEAVDTPLVSDVKEAVAEARKRGRVLEGRLMFEDEVSMRTYHWVYHHPDFIPTYAELQEKGLKANGLYLTEWKREDMGASNDDGKKRRGGGGGDGPTVTQITPTPVIPKKMIVDDRGEYFMEFEFAKPGPCPTFETVLIKMSQLQEEKGALWKDLAAKGMMLTTKKQIDNFRRLAVDLYNKTFQDYYKYTEQGISSSGWHKVVVDHTTGRTELHYITAGYSTTKKIRYTGPETLKWTQAGNETLYLKEMARIFASNPSALVVAGFSAAGFLMDILKEVDHNPMWALLGTTSIGKSTLAKTVLSMRGHPELLLKSMNATEGALLQYMLQSNHTGAVLDEIGSRGGKLSEEEKQKSIYDLASGEERNRLSKSARTGNFEAKTHSIKARYTLLLTGEKGMLKVSSAQGGNLVRLTQFTFDPVNQPLWDSFKDNCDVEAWTTFIASNHGWLAPRIVAQIAAAPERYKKAFASYQKSLVKKLQVGAESRKANSFALAMTGVLVLRDALSEIMDENGVRQPGMRWTHVGAAAKRARQLMMQTMSMTPVISNDEKYGEFLNTILVKYMHSIHAIHTPGGELVQAVKDPIGQITAKPGGLRELALLDSIEDIAVKEHIDWSLFLAWADKAGIYVKATEKKKNPDGSVSMVERKKCKVSINGVSTRAYFFRLHSSLPLSSMEESMDEVLNETKK